MTTGPVLLRLVSTLERIGMQIRAEALAPAGDVRNKALGPIVDGRLNRPSRPYSKTLWDD
jgi:hypothetical protein